VFLLWCQSCKYIFYSCGTASRINIYPLRIYNFSSVSVENIGWSEVWATLFVFTGVVHMNFTAANMSTRKVSQSRGGNIRIGILTKSVALVRLSNRINFKFEFAEWTCHLSNISQFLVCRIVWNVFEIDRWSMLWHFLTERLKVGLVFHITALVMMMRRTIVHF
jgi:hypothetical protein